MFIIKKRLVGDVAPLEYLPSKQDEQYLNGEALVLKDGSLTKAAETDKPTHIAMGPKMINGKVPCVRICEDMVFETRSEAAVAKTLIGSKVTLGTEALSVTATTASGVFVIAETENAIGGKVLGYFA